MQMSLGPMSQTKASGHAVSIVAHCETVRKWDGSISATLSPEEDREQEDHQRSFPGRIFSRGNLIADIFRSCASVASDTCDG